MKFRNEPMKDMEKYWKDVEQTFQNQTPFNRITWAICYAICIACIALALLLVWKMAGRHDEFTLTSMEIPIVLTLLGVTGICLSAFRSKISARVKVYLGCLFFTCAAAYMLIFHPYYETRRMPYPMNIVVCTVACIFFGGGGLWILYNDCRWYWKRRNKNKRKSS